MPLTQLYHTRDPIENLRVHVTLRKIASAASDDATTSRVGTTWDDCFRWQEKKAKKRSTAVRKSKKTHAVDRADDSETESSPPAPAHSSVLCSYIDADNYVSPEELERSVTTAASCTALTHLANARHRRLPLERGLAAAVPTLQKLNTERAWLRHHREEAFRCMHIVASFDGADGSSDAERVLCTLRFDTDTGLLSATPGFSVPIDVGKEDAETIARKGGPKLSTYRLMIAGALFEYTLDNVNDLIPLAAPQDQQLLRELELQDEKHDEARVAALRAREGTGALAQTQQLFFDEMRAQDIVKRRFVLVEIVSAHELQASAPVMVELRLRLPRRQHDEQFYWRLRAPASGVASPALAQLMDGQGIMTRLSRVRRSASGATVAVFNLHLQIDLELCTNAKASDSSRDADPHHGVDSENELPGHADCVVPIMKPVLSIREQLEELFLGADESSEHFNPLRTDATTLRHVNSRLGVHVQSTGASMRVRYNTVDQTAATAHAPSQSANAKSAHAPAQVRPHALPELRVVKRSVNEILQSVRLEKRLAQTPLSSADSGGSATGLSAASAVESVLARLHAAKESAEAPPLTGSI